VHGLVIKASAFGKHADQKTLKVSIHSFPAWCLALKRDSAEIGWQIHLLCRWARHLTEVPLLLSVSPETINARWQLA